MTAASLARRALVAGVVWGGAVVGAAFRQASPPPTTGAAVCGSCHAEQRAAWTAGRHSRMIQPATTSAVVGDFTKPAVVLRGKAYGLRRADGRYYITESTLGGRPVERRIDYTLGSRRIQHYLSTLEDGRIVVLTPTWDVQRAQWFDNVEIIRPDEADGTPVQVWNRNCVGCHVSREERGYDTGAGTYATSWQDFGTSCERCHGDGRTHVAAARTGAGTATPAEGAIVVPTRLDAARATAVCAQCHSLRDVAAPGFEAGADYDDYFVAKLEYTPRKEQDPVYWADGRPRRFSNDAIGFWQSRCYLKGGATCATCHDAHTPNVDRHASLAPANASLCTGCHEAIGRDIAGHAHHREGSAGASCVECHMPKEVVSIKATMRDHTIGVPAPANTVAFGIPNACTTCHTTKPATWAVARMQEWWPAGRQRAMVARAEAFTGGRAGRPEALPRLLALAADREAAPLTRANALGYLRRYRIAAAVQALTSALAAATPVERMVAASSLTQPGTAPALVAALADPVRSVRLAALVSLVNQGAPPPSATALARVRFVASEFAAQAALHEDDAVTQTDLGMVRLAAGDADRAAAALEHALVLAPGDDRATFVLGLAREVQRRGDDARALFRRVPPSAPFYAAAQARLRQLAPR